MRYTFNGTTRDEIEQKFLRAILTVDVLDDPDASWFAIRSSWPKFPRTWFAYSTDPDDALEPRFVPTPADHDRMLDALAWGRTLGRLEWRICRDVADGYSDMAIADRMRLPIAEIADRYEAAIHEVCRAALADA